MEVEFSSWKEAVLRTFEDVEKLALQDMYEYNVEILRGDGVCDKSMERIETDGCKDGVVDETRRVGCNKSGGFKNGIINAKKVNKNAFKNEIKNKLKNEIKSGLKSDKDVFSYPLKTQEQVRNFVKSLKKRNISIEVMSERTGEEVYSFWQWINHCGRPWVGVKMMRVVNREVEGVYDGEGGTEVVKGFEQVTFFDKKKGRVKKKKDKVREKVYEKTVNPDYLKELKNHELKRGREQRIVDENIKHNIENIQNIKPQNKNLKNGNDTIQKFKRKINKITSSPQKEITADSKVFNDDKTNKKLNNVNSSSINNNNINNTINNNKIRDIIATPKVISQENAIKTTTITTSPTIHYQGTNTEFVQSRNTPKLKHRGIKEGGDNKDEFINAIVQTSTFEKRSDNNSNNLMIVNECKDEMPMKQVNSETKVSNRSAFKLTLDASKTDENLQSAKTNNNDSKKSTHSRTPSNAYISTVSETIPSTTEKPLTNEFSTPTNECFNDNTSRNKASSRISQLIRDFNLKSNSAGSPNRPMCISYLSKCSASVRYKKGQKYDCTLPHHLDRFRKESQSDRHIGRHSDAFPLKTTQASETEVINMERSLDSPRTPSKPPRTHAGVKRILYNNEGKNENKLDDSNPLLNREVINDDGKRDNQDKIERSDGMMVERNENTQKSLGSEKEEVIVGYKMKSEKELNFSENWFLKGSQSILKRRESCQSGRNGVDDGLDHDSVENYTVNKKGLNECTFDNDNDCVEDDLTSYSNTLVRNERKINAPETLPTSNKSVIENSTEKKKKKLEKKNNRMKKKTKENEGSEGASSIKISTSFSSPKNIKNLIVSYTAIKTTTTTITTHNHTNNHDLEVEEMDGKKQGTNKNKINKNLNDQNNQERQPKQIKSKSNGRISSLIAKFNQL